MKNKRKAAGGRAVLARLFQAARGFFSRHRAAPALLLALAAFIIIFSALCVIFPLPDYRLNMDFSTVHSLENGDLLRITLSKSGRYRIKTQLSGISPIMKKGILAYEDRIFYLHPGLNPFAIARAAILNLSKGRVVSGGSTITQQLARLIEPKKRTFSSKLIEAFRALQFQLFYSKDKVLEYYLNTIPMGGNIEGVGAASYIYFNKPPSQLTAGEAAILISLPKSPNRRRPDLHPDEAIRARNQVLSRIAGDLKIGAGMLEKLCLEPMPKKRFKNPYRLFSLVNKKLIRDDFTRTYFINAGYQATVEYLLKKTVDRLKKYGIYNGAVIVVENRTQKVLCYAGSPDCSDSLHGGELDGVSVLRSPGSALKPFLYGMAIDRGMLTPKKAVYDIYKEYEGYKPANFEKIYHGIITAEEALTRSYNIPAVQLEFALKKNGIYGMLDRIGFIDNQRKRINPGLSVVLGAMPVSLEELVVLYAALADGGKARRLKYTTLDLGGREDDYKQIVSPEAAYIITEMLANGERPDLPQSWEFTNYRGKVAFKTGTSFGLRDAWCAGYTPEYTVGVWLGNMDASSSFELIGIKAAAPLLMEIFNFLTRFSDKWFEKPEKVKTRRVCALSGDSPGDWCGGETTDYYIEGVTPLLQCGVHRRIYINKKTGNRADPSKISGPKENYTEKIVEVWPPEVALFLRKNGGHLPYIPPYGEGEGPGGETQKPKILSPVNNSDFTITKAMPYDAQRIALRAAVPGAGNSVVKWFVNGKAVASAKADEIVYIKPEAGEWEISMQDEAGGYESVKIRVTDTR